VARIIPEAYSLVLISTPSAAMASAASITPFRLIAAGSPKSSAPGPSSAVLMTLVMSVPIPIVSSAVIASV
jgi:hypothetical protein